MPGVAVESSVSRRIKALAIRDECHYRCCQRAAMHRVLGRTTAAVLAVTLLAGCSAHRRMIIPGQTPPRPDATGVAPGDFVRITLQSGTSVSFTVAEVHPDVLVSTTGQRIAFDSMTRLEARKFALGRTLLLTAATLTLVVFVLTAAAYASLASGL